MKQRVQETIVNSVRQYQITKKTWLVSLPISALFCLDVGGRRGLGVVHGNNQKTFEAMFTATSGMRTIACIVVAIAICLLFCSFSRCEVHMSMLLCLITDGLVACFLTYCSMFMFQRLHKCLQTLGFDVIGILSADVGNLCKVNYRLWI